MKITKTVVQKKELATLNRLQDDFLRTISHELRTPVTNMTMAMPMLTFT
jgi:signal transduction histidine kinase